MPLARWQLRNAPPRSPASRRPPLQVCPIRDHSYRPIAPFVTSAEHQRDGHRCKLLCQTREVHNGEARPVAHFMILRRSREERGNRTCNCSSLSACWGSDPPLACAALLCAHNQGWAVKSCCVPGPPPLLRVLLIAAFPPSLEWGWVQWCCDGVHSRTPLRWHMRIVGTCARVHERSCKACPNFFFAC